MFLGKQFLFFFFKKKICEKKKKKNKKKGERSFRIPHMGVPYMLSHKAFFSFFIFVFLQRGKRSLPAVVTGSHLLLGV